MRFLQIASVLATLAVSVSGACQEVDGNWYCDKTDAITYENMGLSSSYHRITGMNEKTCVCDSQEYHFSGAMTPLDEELSVHVRGPTKLEQFAVYYPEVRLEEGATAELVEEEPLTDEEQLAMENVRYRKARKFLQMFKNYGASTDWKRDTYYKPGTGENVVFLNNKGGVTSSGVWSSCFGNSLSYMAADGVSASAKKELLGDVTIPSDTEYSIWQAKECNGQCGYYRPGTPAYKGFGGGDKLFLFEFQMPTDDKTKPGSFLHDMPAIWLLNALIPRTVQYGPAACSCWTTGCGELDLFEILSSGEDKCTSTLHDGQSDATANWFARPIHNKMKAAVLFHAASKAVHVQVLDDNFDFSATLNKEQIDKILAKVGTVVKLKA